MTSKGPQTIRKAEGESVTLGCSYKPSPRDTGELDIEWSVISPDTTQKDQMVRSNVRSTQTMLSIKCIQDEFIKLQYSEVLLFYAISNVWKHLVIFWVYVPVIFENMFFGTDCSS